MEITTNDPIGLFVSCIFTDSNNSDRVLIELQSRINKAIKLYSDKPADKERCEILQRYLKAYRELCNQRPDCEAKREIVEQLTEIINTLQTGIDREPYAQKASKPEEQTSKWGNVLDCCYKRWEVFGLQNRPITTNPDTLEGYIRKIPGIKGMGFVTMMDKYGADIISKFMPPKPSEVKTVEDSMNYVDKCVTKIADKYTFVQLTTRYDDTVRNDELYSFVMEIESSPSPEPATAGA